MSVIVLAYVALLAIHVLSLRVEVVPGEIHVAALPIRRRYHLTDEPPTRLHPPPAQGWFRTQLGGFGIEIGLGRLREQEIVVVRLAPRTDVVVIRCAEGRLAIAPSSDERLIRAVEAAQGRRSGQSIGASRY